MRAPAKTFEKCMVKQLEEFLSMCTFMVDLKNSRRKKAYKLKSHIRYNFIMISVDGLRLGILIECIKPYTGCIDARALDSISKSASIRIEIKEDKSEHIEQGMLATRILKHRLGDFPCH